MNVTFLIGNGFDLNFRLKTSFTDFLEYHKSKGFTDDLSKAIELDTPYWSNLEYALGQSLSTVSKESVEVFLQNKGMLDNSLIEYLSMIDNEHDVIFQSGAADEFSKKITNFYMEFREIERDRYVKYRDGVNGTLYYHFITFNYTTFLDRIIKEAKKLVPFGQHKYRGSNTQYNDELSFPLHIHGDLQSDMLLGVNDITQLNCSPDVVEELSPFMIKPNMNEFYGDQKILHAKEIIDKSNYVCIFGMSLGLTDLMWWQYLYEWLQKNNNNRLVLYSHSKNTSLASGTMYWWFVKQKRRQFIDLVKTNEGDNQVENQIIVLPNSPIFTFEKIKVEKKNGQNEDAHA